MVPLLLTWLLLTNVQEPDPPAPGPSPELVAETRARLEAALGSEDLRAIESALQDARTVPHPDVVRCLSRGLEDARPRVRLGTVETLRWLDHAQAVRLLHEAARDRDLMKDVELAASVLRAIGQHAEPASVEVLAHLPFEPDDPACRRARVLGLGRIRTRESLEALLRILAEVRGPRGERRILPQMKDVRTSLILLTGLDRGLEPMSWEAWWRENRKTFRIPEEAARLPAELVKPWNEFWGLPAEEGRPTRREDRGGSGRGE